MDKNALRTAFIEAAVEPKDKKLSPQFPEASVHNSALVPEAKVNVAPALP